MNRRTTNILMNQNAILHAPPGTASERAGRLDESVREKMLIYARARQLQSGSNPEARVCLLRSGSRGCFLFPEESEEGSFRGAFVAVNGC